MEGGLYYGQCQCQYSDAITFFVSILSLSLAFNSILNAVSWLKCLISQHKMASSQFFKCHFQIWNVNSFFLLIGFRMMIWHNHKRLWFFLSAFFHCCCCSKKECFTKQAFKRPSFIKYAFWVHDLVQLRFIFISSDCLFSLKFDKF